ncbi:MAG: Xaa-Pro peptidase family protein [Armatimonadetes bacterium]|nr:Xaa-Pro peptidase family protein [Armatimonadota bacterium]
MSHLDQMRSALAASGTPAFIVTDLANLRWLTGFTGSFGQAVVSATAAVFISDSRYTLQAEEQARDFAVRTFANPVDGADVLLEELRAACIDRLAFDKANVTMGALQRWEAKLTGVTLSAADDPIGRLRAVKDADEVALIRRACRLADQCMERLLGRIRAGVTEKELAWEIEVFFHSQGAGMAFPAIVVSGERSARPHGAPSDKQLQAGDFITFDFGASVEGYYSDITRTVVLGSPSERQREIYAEVLKAQMAALSAIAPGASGKAVDGIARASLERAGLAQHFGHGLGHGLGALVHDAGRLSPTIDWTLETGQVMTVEPGVYIEGLGGVRIEDDVLVTTDGCEVLTRFPKELLCL